MRRVRDAYCSHDPQHEYSDPEVYADLMEQSAHGFVLAFAPSLYNFEREAGWSHPTTPTIAAKLRKVWVSEGP